MAEQRRRRPLIIVIPIALVLAALGWWGYTAWQATRTIESGVIQASGTVEAVESQVASILSGRIESSEATEGVAVRMGDVLFRIDDELLKLQVDQAKAGQKAAKAALKQAKDDDESKAAIAVAQARVDQAEAAVTIAQTQAGYAEVTAPIDGVVTALAAHVGENASPGKALASVADLSKLHVSVFIAETQIGQVSIGDNATVTADGSADEYSGRVTFIASEAEFTPNSIETEDQRTKLVYEVRVTLADANDFLKPGMPVDVVIETGD